MAECPGFLGFVSRTGVPLNIKLDTTETGFDTNLAIFGKSLLAGFISLSPRIPEKIRRFHDLPTCILLLLSSGIALALVIAKERTGSVLILPLVLTRWPLLEPVVTHG